MKNIKILILLALIFIHTNYVYANSINKNLDNLEYKIEDYDSFNINNIKNNSGICTYTKKRNFALQVFIDLPKKGIIEVFLDNEKLSNIYIEPKYLTYTDIFQKNLHREKNFENSFIFYPNSYILQGSNYNFLINKANHIIKVEYSNFDNIEEVLENTVSRDGNDIVIEIKSQAPKIVILQKNYLDKRIEEKIKLKKGTNRIPIDIGYDYFAIVLYYKNSNKSYEYKKEIIKNKIVC